MNKKIDLTVLLKDCPSGMELDCLMYEDVYFDYVDERNIIHCYIQHETHKTSITFNQHGTHNNDIKSKCVIFPKGKTTWEGFAQLCKFKNGDIITNSYFKTICIFKGEGNIKGTVDFYCGIDNSGKYFFIKDIKDQSEHFGEINGYNFATEEEKAELFQAIKDNGYKWNPETKTLEKLKKEKFDPKTLQPFDKVLARQFKDRPWIADFHSYYDVYRGQSVGTGEFRYYYCIPYNEDTKHLLGSSNEAPEFYRYWEN